MGVAVMLLGGLERGSNGGKNLHSRHWPKVAAYFAMHYRVAQGSLAGIVIWGPIGPPQEGEQIGTVLQIAQA